MAEGWARHLSGSAHTVASAGIEAHGLNPCAVRVMHEAGVDISGQTSDTLDAFDLLDFDMVVTVCGDADERCPLLPTNIHKLHWSLEDPAKLAGTEEQILQGFRQSRDDIRTRVSDLLAALD